MDLTAFVILSPGFEEIEAITVTDILRRIQAKAVLVALNDNLAVMGAHGMVLMAEETLPRANLNRGQILVLPGGMPGVEKMLESEALLAQVESHHQQGKCLAAVCAAPLVLDRLGILSPGGFTCHPSVWPRLKTQGVQDVPAMIRESVVTGRSAGCAMAWSLALVEHCLGHVPENLLAGLRLP
ncbi:MAG: DJ-1/PfpI family protein [Proteobacteria bacterium]|nr:DJ-1/PfpI family protein [Pseudomonadota bacterium]